MADIKSDKKSTFNIKLILGVSGWVVIYTAVVLGIGAYFMHKYDENQTKKTAQAVSEALKSAPVAAVPSKE